MFHHTDHPLISPVVACIGLATLAYLFCYFLWTNIFGKSSRTQKPPPPEIHGGLPVIGHLLYFKTDSKGDRHLALKLGDLADKYGPIFTYRLGFRRFLVVSSFEAVKECFSINDIHFANRPALLSGEHLGYNNAMLSLANYGPYWKKIRKLLNQQVLSASCLENLKYVRNSIVKKNVKKLYGFDHLINLTDWIDKLAFDIILKIVAGKNYDNGHGEVLKVAFQKFMVFAVEFELYDVFPIKLCKWVDLKGNIKSMKGTFKDIDRVFQGWLDEHINEREKQMEVDGKEQDFIDAILSKTVDDLGDSHPHDTTIKAAIFSLMIDATETLPLHIKWIIALLINNKEVMKKAQEEIDTIVGRVRWVEERDIKNLRYLQAIIKEAFRLYPPAPLLAPHESVEDCVINGYHIPKGTTLLANVRKLHRDSLIWPNPDEFQPERFLTSHANIDYRGKNFELIPFGTGRRTCPAMTYAIQVEHLSIAQLIQGFDIATQSNDPLDLEEGVGITTPMKNTIEVLVTPRLNPELYHYTYNA